MRVDLKVDNLIVDMRNKELNRDLGELIRETMFKQLNASKETVAPETVERRLRAARQRGKPTRSFQKRYAGGRIGFKAPQEDYERFGTRPDKWGVDSGRLLRHMAVRLRKRSGGESVATINVPVNRLEPVAFGRGFRAFMAKLKTVMPILEGDIPPRDRPEWRRRIEAMTDGIISNNEKLWLRKKRDLRRAQIAAIRALGGFL